MIPSRLRALKLVLEISKQNYNVDELATMFRVNKRSIYRDLLAIEEAGFLIDKDSDFKYFIFKNAQHEPEQF